MTQTEQPVSLLVFGLERLVNFWRRFAHRLQGLTADMLRCDFKLSADVILAELGQKIMLLIHQ